MLAFLQTTNMLNLYISYISWQHFRHLSRIRFRLHVYELTFISGGDVSTIVTHRMLSKWTYSSHVCGNTAGYFRPDYRTCNKLVSSKRTRYCWRDVRKICSWKLISSLFMAKILDVFDKTSAQFTAVNRICSMRCQDIFQLFLATELDIFDQTIWKPKTGVGTFPRQVSNNKPHILGEDVGMSYSWKQDNFHETLGSFLVVFLVTKLDVSHEMLEQFAVKIMIFLTSRHFPSTKTGYF